MTTKRPFWTTAPSRSSAAWPTAQDGSADISSIMNDSSRWGQYVWDSAGGALRAYAVIGSMETAAILFLNSALCVLILSSPSLRARLRNQLLVSLAVANLLVGFYSAPLSVDLALNVRWEVGCLVELTRKWLTVYAQHLVTGWGVALLLLHYAARLARWEAPAWLPLLLRHPRLLRLAGLAYVLTPWLLAALVAAPLLAAGRVTGVDWLLQGFRRCPVHLAAETRIALNVLSFYLPDLVIVVLLVAVTVWVGQGRASWLAASAEKEKEEIESGREAAVAERATDVEGQRKVEAGTAGLVTSDDDLDLDLDPALVHLLVGVATVALLSPHHLRSLLLSHGALPRGLGALKVSVALQAVEGLLFVLVPALWLALLPDLARRGRELRCRLRERLADCSDAVGRCGRSPPVEDAAQVPPVSFRYLEDE